jgi:hypothetical protein
MGIEIMSYRRLLSASVVMLLVAGTPSFINAQTVRASAEAGKPTYGQLVSAGYDLLTEGKVKEAYVAAVMAAKSDPGRFESYALAALVMHTRGANVEAREFVGKALGRVPADKKPKLRELAKAIDDSLASAPNHLTGVDRQKPLTPAASPSLKRAEATAARPEGVKASPSVAKVPGAQTAAPRREVVIGQSSRGYANLRKGPATSTPVVGRVHPGEVYTYSRVVDGWYLLDGKQAWIASRYASPR